MDRRYYRQYENFDTVIPKIEDFPTLRRDNPEIRNTTVGSNESFFGNLHIDDIILIVILVLLLSEEDKDITAILGVAFLFLAGYIF